MRYQFFSNGTLQKDRAETALLPAYVDVEEKTIGDYLVFVKEYTQLIRYWNAQNHPEGNWQPFFEEDLSILLAYIGHVDVSDYPKQHNRISKDFRPDSLEIKQEKALVQLLLLNLKITNLIKDWYQQIRSQATMDAQKNGIEILLTELIKANVWDGGLEIENCYKSMWFIFQQPPDTTAGESLAKSIYLAQEFFDEIEVLKGTPTDKHDSPPLKLISSPIDFSNYQGFFNYLDQLYRSLFGTISLIQKAIPGFLEESLQQSNHAPHISLLLAFWEMLGQTKQLANQFTAKHLNFYYLDVLQQQYATSIPDQVLLYFALAPTETQAFIPKGTAFLAGTSPSGQALHYSLDKDLAVNQAQPILFKTLYNATANAPVVPTEPYLLYAAPIANSGNGMGGKFLQTPPSWPSLGADLKNADSPNLAQLGFAISNPILYLSEGSRQITVILKFSKESVDTLKQEVIKLGINEQDYWEGLELLIHRSFMVDYTSPKAWISLLPSQFDTWLLPLPDGSLGVGFFIQLNSTQAPVSAYNSKKHGEGYTADGPLLRFIMTQQITIKASELSKKIAKGSPWDKDAITLNPYRLLSQLTIKEISIYVEADGVQDFSIQNDFSVLNPKKPYAPFGVTPVANNHFYLGNNEIFRKQLTFLKLKIQWYDLPKLANGFCDYYSDYNRFEKDKPFYNSVFKWKLDLLAGENQTLSEKWKPLSFTSKLATLPPPSMPPLNPSDPKSSIYDSLKDGSQLKPPKAITPETAKGILNDLAKHYGKNWAKNSQKTSTDKNETGDPTKPPPILPPESITPEMAKDILNKMAQHYGPDWAKNNNNSEKGKPSDAITPDLAKAILSELSAHYGKNWAKNSPPEKTTDPQKSSKPLQAPTGNPIARKLAEVIIKALKPAPKKASKPIAAPPNKTVKTHSSIPLKDPTKNPTGSPSKKEETSNSIFAWEQISSNSDSKKSSPKPPQRKSQIDGATELLKMAEEHLTDPDKLKELAGALETLAKEKKNTPPPTTPKPTEKNQTPNPQPIPLSPATITCPYKEEGKLKPETFVIIDDFKKIKWDEVSSPTPFSPKTVYSDQTKDGFLRFTLAAPYYAFGEAEYPRVVAAVANFNIQLMADKIEKAINKHETPPPKPPKTLSEKLMALMPGVEALMYDPYLRIIQYYPGEHLKKPYHDALKATRAVDEILATGDAKKSVSVLAKDFNTIHNFIYALGIVLHKSTSLIPNSDKEKGLLGKAFHFVFGHLPILKKLSGVLLLSHPLLKTGVSTLTKIIGGDICKEMKGLTAEWTAAAKASHAAIADIKAASGSSTPPPTPLVTKPLLPPRPAYVPKIAKITANYRAEAQVNFTTAADGSSQFFHLHPFGISAPQAPSPSSAMGLLPIYSEEGYLFIALEKINAEEMVTLLFVLNAESGDRDLSLPAISWHYLDKGQWVQFLPSSVKDGTNGFSQSGVITFNLPYLDNTASNLFIDHAKADDYYWLRATVAEHADAVCEIIDVYAQAGTASYASGDLDPAHFNAPLPAKKISKFQIPDPTIVKIVQPIASFGGRASEDEASFYTRVNERLRHKDRAVSAWDFEHLTLQQFPAIGLAKCLNHTSLTNANCPGNIALIILPGMESGISPSLSPKTDQGQIKRVEQYLESHVDPFVKLHVRNPSYEYLRIELELELTAGADPGHYLKVLNAGLINEIAPWHSDYQNTNPFSTNISYFSLLEYINRQTYVEEVAKFKITRLQFAQDKKGKKIKKSFNKIEAKVPWGIISSVAQHQFKVLTEKELQDALAKQKKKKQKKKKLVPLKKPTDQTAKQKTPITETKPLEPINNLKKQASNNALFIGNDLYNSPNL